MLENFNVILKITLISLIISLAIKYGGSFLVISPSQLNVMIAVFLPSVVMGGLFLWRWTKG